MWKSIATFLGGVVAALLIAMKLKQPTNVNVSGDYVKDQKNKDNSKHKLSRKERRIERRKARILRKENK
jgi:hypothetical protein